MFGYVKPLKSELLVRHYELYQALYCGLCDTIFHKVSPALTLALNYDFVFLAIVRAMAADQRFDGKRKRCAAHPLKKRACVASCEPLEYSARAALLLTYENLSDDLKDPDTPFFKRILFRFYRRILKRDRKKLLKKHPEYGALSDSITRLLSEMNALEEENCSDPDRFSGLFGQLMKEIVSFGLEGEAKAICGEIGDYTGRLIYTVDACDDLLEDEKSGAFNPLLKRYGSAAQAQKHFREIDMVISIYASRIDAAIGLFSTQKDYKSIAHNIASRGIADLSRSILNKQKKGAAVVPR